MLLLFPSRQRIEATYLCDIFRLSEVYWLFSEPRRHAHLSLHDTFPTGSVGTTRYVSIDTDFINFSFCHIFRRSTGSGAANLLIKQSFIRGRTSIALASTEPARLAGRNALNIFRLFRTMNPEEEIVLALQRSLVSLASESGETAAARSRGQQQGQQQQQQQEQLHHLLEHGHRRPIIQDKSRNARTDSDLLNIAPSKTASVKARARHPGECDVNYAPMLETYHQCGNLPQMKKQKTEVESKLWVKRKMFAVSASLSAWLHICTVENVRLLACHSNKKINFSA